MNNGVSPGDGRRSAASPSKALIRATALATGILTLAAGGVFFSQSYAMPNLGLLQSAATSATSQAAAGSSPRLVEHDQLFSFADLVERVAPAVVTVQVDVERGIQPAAMPEMPPQSRDFFRRFEDNPGSPRFDNAPGPNQRSAPPPRRFRTQAAGSGFIIGQDGYIVTNNHVVESARRITITLSDQREFEARLIGADKDTDVALLKIEARNLPTVELGDDSALRVGDWVVAVGNPFGLGGTVTAGIVSSIGRHIGNGAYTDHIQIDAPINQGNSGGPTFDISGRVIGMNTAIFSPTGGSVGIGFCVPASTIKSVVDELRTNGNVTRGWLGVQIQDFTPELASGLGIKDAKGAMVGQVIDGSPAARAGFEQGDIVVAVNGESVNGSRALTRHVAELRAGERATFTVMRGGERRTLTALIERRDA